MVRGKLILVEGLDRTGKTTQVNALARRLHTEGIPVHATKFPNRESEIGQLINRYLTDKSFTLPDQAVHLLFSANRWEYIKELKQKLNQGCYVVLDRYVFSGIAYSAAKGVQGMDLNWCMQSDKGLLKPDLTLFLTNEDSLANRDGFGEERYESNEFQLKVKAKFSEVLDAFCDPDELSIVNVTGKDIDQVSEEIWSRIVPILKSKLQEDDFKYF
ncbi:Thymidylate kinase [Nakaseomyces bracarensis]|uniref:dTMP kinase n=1 Tax=Nakaseomyces bracarensis TaxID=273131 RepID=A0ABR4NTR5_9SACH